MRGEGDACLALMGWLTNSNLSRQDVSCRGMAVPAAAAPVTPSCAPQSTTTPRRPNVPLHIRERIFTKANEFEYYESKLRTKEEKQLFIKELTKKLNERYMNETGVWDETRTATLVRNLKKDKTSLPIQKVETNSMQVSSPVEQLLIDWQTTLTSASRLNSNTLARHPSNRGSCNEELIKGFLSSTLSSRYIGIGSGEILSSSSSSSASHKTRQLDIILYNPEYPCLRPAQIGTSFDGLACFYEESIMTVIEVKTTLTNQDLHDVATSASMLPKSIPFFIFSFDSQSSLKAIDTSKMPVNVVGIFTISHGSLVRRANNDWSVIHPSKNAPLIEFYRNILQQLLIYATNQEEAASNAFIRVLETLLNQVSKDVVTYSDSLSYLENQIDACTLREIDMNHKS